MDTVEKPVNGQVTEGDAVKQNPDGSVSRIDDDVVTVTINKTHLIALAEDGKTLVFNPNAEQAILKLLELQKLVNDTVGVVQGEIAARGLEYNPAFTSVAGDVLKANYQAAGAKYKPNPEVALKLHNPLFWKQKTDHSIISDAVEAYEMKHHGKLPKGIVKAERTKKIQFKIKAGK